ncbi:PKD domain-containing protein [Nocardioides sambongensis]|uniref:PKD domain-containing protein n=1 Tax=Nocardioides sambongensis TaxID=2589074 RepID=UPI00112D174A|nr:PKD domain-containing protein [Nocardioides sambongensis]
MVARAFRRLTWPASTLVIQPTNGRTLVNFDTNFYTTDTEPITQTVRLLGRPITIEATPVQYHWHFDDGASLTTEEPGAAYPELTITHRYLTTGRYRPSLDTTYGGRYRVGNGPWQQIPGTHTVAGAAQSLRAIEASPTLVDPD